MPRPADAACSHSSGGHSSSPGASRAPTKPLGASTECGTPADEARLPYVSGDLSAVGRPLPVRSRTTDMNENVYSFKNPGDDLETKLAEIQVRYERWRYALAAHCVRLVTCRTPEARPATRRTSRDVPQGPRRFWRPKRAGVLFELKEVVHQALGDSRVAISHLNLGRV
jgi:hypothetical protein